jgi:predicted patatin/cPLA2 family phospholipase
MSAAREADQADFDLERFVDMFDEALTSQDPRVMDALRSLMMMVILTRPEKSLAHGRREGPLRRLFEDMNHLNRRMHDMEEKISDIRQQEAKMSSAEKYRYEQYPNEKYSLTATAAQAVAAQDVLGQLKMDARNRVQGLK